MRLGLPKGLLNRLMLLTGLSLISAVFLQAAISLYTQGQAGIASAERLAVAIAKTLATGAADHVVASQFDAIDNLTEAAVKFEDVSDVQILNGQGLVLSHFEIGRAHV